MSATRSTKDAGRRTPQRFVAMAKGEIIDRGLTVEIGSDKHQAALALCRGERAAAQPDLAGRPHGGALSPSAPMHVGTRRRPQRLVLARAQLLRRSTQ
jgi:hypothetical protein